MDIAVSLPSDKLLEVQWLALSLLETQSVWSCHFWAMQLLCQQTFTAFLIVSCHSELHVESCFILLLTYFFSFHLSCISLRDCLSCNIVCFPCDLLFLMGLSLWMPNHWAFYFHVSGLPLSFNRTWAGFMFKVYIVLQELQAFVLVLYRMAYFIYLVGLLFYIWLLVWLMLTYVIRMSHCLFFFSQ